MRFLVGLLAVVLVLLQYRLWLSENGVRESVHLRAAVAAQRAENEELSRRNAQLAAEVIDLRKGTAALEERARNDLGMIGRAETFYQVVPPGTPLSARPNAAPVPGVAPEGVPTEAAATPPAAAAMPIAAPSAGALQPAAHPAR